MRTNTNPARGSGALEWLDFVPTAHVEFVRHLYEAIFREKLTEKFLASYPPFSRSLGQARFPFVNS